MTFRVRNSLVRIKNYGRLVGPRLGIDRHCALTVHPGAKMTIGHMCHFARSCTVVVRGQLSIGDRFFANERLYLSAFSSVTIGSGVLIGEGVSIHDENHRRDIGKMESEAYDCKPIVISDDVWIGAQCILLPGASIGAGAVIGAGSTVIGHIPAGAIAVGSPARVVRPGA